MTVMGPGTRSLTIDNAAGAPTAYATAIAGDFDWPQLEHVLQEVTNCTNVAPAFLPTTFKRVPQFTITFVDDVGGAPDPRADFLATATASRSISFAMTEATGKTNSGEAYIATSGEKADKENLNLIVVTFQPTGVWTRV